METRGGGEGKYYLKGINTFAFEKIDSSHLPRISLSCKLVSVRNREDSTNVAYSETAWHFA